MVKVVNCIHLFGLSRLTYPYHRAFEIRGKSRGQGNGDSSSNWKIEYITWHGQQFPASRELCDRLHIVDRHKKHLKFLS